MHRIFFFLAGFFLLTGLFYYFGGKWGIGKLPGDINLKGENIHFHFPIVTCVIVSVLISAVVWVINQFRG